MSPQFTQTTAAAANSEPSRDGLLRGRLSHDGLSHDGLSRSESSRGGAPGAISQSAEGSILALDADASTVRICLLEPVNQRYRLLGQQVAPRAMDRLIATQFAQLATQMGDKLGRTLWDAHSGGPLLQSADPIRRPPIEHVVGAITLHPWVRVWLAGLSNEGSLAAAWRVAPRGPIQVVGQTVLQAAANVSDIGVSLAAASPDLLILCGGYDAEQQTIRDSALRLVELLTNALNRLAPAQHPTVLYAGNQRAAVAVEQHLRAQIPTVRLQTIENLLPRPGRLHYASLLEAVEQEQLRLSRRTPDYGRISQWLTGPAGLMNMEAAFVRFVRAWRVLEKLDEIHALYATSQRWLHVRVAQSPSADTADEIEIYFVPTNTRPPALAGWPALRLVSGAWPEAHWPRPQNGCWDRQALAPTMAAVGQISPIAMQQVAAADLF